MSPDIEEVLGDATVARLRDIVGERTDAVVAVATPEGEMVWASEPGSQEIFGREQVDFAGHSQFEYLHPDDHALFRAKTQLVLGGQTARFVVRVTSAHDTWVRVATIAWAVRTAQGPLIVSITVPQDSPDL